MECEQSPCEEDVPEKGKEVMIEPSKIHSYEQRKSGRFQIEEWIEEGDVGNMVDFGLRAATAGLPVPSCELGHVIQAKAWATWSLETGAMREAGFTEQRSPRAHDSGRITSRGNLGQFSLAGCFK
ncbi:hypothetical protein RJ639_036754 [Escallonia herrerae]|uniref:Uncharacterized protein n=1 Tax=Escallonia herrerae TaxID=1293975 RepID=A0AA88X5F9_9ASTE|nr:hypothetical protein RJ639_036754 [Escallonia herrerae]